MESATRTRVLKAALALFTESSVEATRTSDICARAGISNGSLFHAFPSKDAIAAALYLDAIATYQAALLSALTDAPSTEAALRAVVTAQCRWAEEGAEARFLFSFGRGITGETARRIGERNRLMAAAVEAWRGEPAQAGRLRPMPIATFLAILIGPSLMAIRAWLGRAGDPPSLQAAAFADAAVHSLMLEQAHA